MLNIQCSIFNDHIHIRGDEEIPGKRTKEGLERPIFIQQKKKKKLIHKKSHPGDRDGLRYFVLN